MSAIVPGISATGMCSSTEMLYARSNEARSSGASLKKQFCS